MYAENKEITAGDDYLHNDGAKTDHDDDDCGNVDAEDIDEEGEEEQEDDDLAADEDYLEEELRGTSLKGAEEQNAQKEKWIMKMLSKSLVLIKLFTTILIITIVKKKNFGSI